MQARIFGFYAEKLGFNLKRAEGKSGTTRRSVKNLIESTITQ